VQSTLSGGCLCGAVRYEIDGKLRHITHCHCGMCRKSHGAAFATYASLSRERFRLTSGDGALRTYRSSKSVTRQFCGTCGSSLFWSDDQYPQSIEVALGTLDGDPGGRPVAHIFVKDRASWNEITDALPRFDGNVPADSD
jgi:hypothetical protein